MVLLESGELVQSTIHSANSKIQRRIYIDNQICNFSDTYLTVNMIKLFKVVAFVCRSTRCDTAT